MTDLLVSSLMADGGLKTALKGAIREDGLISTGHLSKIGTLANFFVFLFFF